MAKRKIQRSGHSSFVVSLPIEWVKAHGLNKNDEIEIMPNPDSTITISAEPRIEFQDSVEFSLKQDSDYSKSLRELFSLYIAGYSQIRVVADDSFPVFAHQLIDTFVAKTIGLEVTEEDHGHFLITDVLDPKTMPMDKALRRMASIAKKMISDCFGAISENNFETAKYVERLDDDVDRLYTLLFRKNCKFLRNPSIARKEGMTLEKSHWIFLSARMVERIADHALRISRFSTPLIQKGRDEVLRKLVLATGQKASSVFEMSIKAFFEKDKNLANSLISKSESIKSEFDEILERDYRYRGKVSVPVAYIVEGMRRITDHSCSICENILDSRE